MSKASQWLSERALATFCLGILAVGYAVIAIGPGAITYVPALLLISLRTAFARPVLVASYSHRVPAEGQGVAMGINLALMSGMNMIGPLLGA